MIIIQTLITETVAIPPQYGGSVAFEVVLSKAVKAMPYLMIYQDSFHADGPDPAISYTVCPYASTGNSFLFEIPNQDGPKYFSLAIKEGEVIRYLISNYHFEPGDDIVMKVGNNDDQIPCQLDFSGTGVAKYQCLTEIRNRILFDEIRLAPMFNVVHVYNTNNRNIRNIHLALILLKKYKSELSAYSYELLKVDIMAAEWRVLIANFKQKITAVLKSDDTYAYLHLCNEYRNKLKLDFEMPVSALIKHNSLVYPHFMVDKIVLGYLKKYVKLNFVKIYYLIYITTDHHDLRDKMIVIFLIKYKAEMKGHYNSLLKHAVTHLKSKKCMDKLMGILLTH